MLEPLSSILRPDKLDNFVWQKHLVWEKWPIRTFLQNWRIPSMIFWWPAWCGKTTITYIIYKTIKADFYHLSWVSSKKEDLTKILKKAKTNFQEKIPTIVFLDEIHRWNKAQQDALLPYVEKWIITLIWATTENPSFTVNNALISRCRVFVFKPIEAIDISDFLEKNLEKIKTHYPDITIPTEALELIWQLGNWDLRNSINILESALIGKIEWELDKQTILESTERSVYYDRNWEEHYNIISAVHKSLRDSDADWACYWIGRMLYSWEDPLYIVRRLIRFASEDIWIADNNAIILANTVYDSVHKIWMPECDIFVYQLAYYLAKAPKNNTIYAGHYKIKEDFQKYGNLPVPMHIRNAPTKLMKNLWYWAWYKYAHDYKDAHVEQEHFPDELKWRKYFE